MLPKSLQILKCPGSWKELTPHPQSSFPPPLLSPLFLSTPFSSLLLSLCPHPPATFSASDSEPLKEESPGSLNGSCLPEGSEANLSEPNQTQSDQWSHTRSGTATESLKKLDKSPAYSLTPGALPIPKPRGLWGHCEGDVPQRPWLPRAAPRRGSHQ